MTLISWPLQSYVKFLHESSCSKACAGMEPGPEHFGRSERLLLDTMSAEMSVSALVSPK